MLEDEHAHEDKPLYYIKVFVIAIGVLITVAIIMGCTLYFQNSSTTGNSERTEGHKVSPLAGTNDEHSTPLSLRNIPNNLLHRIRGSYITHRWFYLATLVS